MNDLATAHERRLALELDELAGRSVPPDRCAEILQRVHKTDRRRERAGRWPQLAAAAMMLLGLAITVAFAVEARRSADDRLGMVPPPTPPTTDATASSAPRHPAGTDPADLRAVRSAELMLAAEARLVRMLQDGELPFVDRRVPFETLQCWPYRQGLLGLPEVVRELSGQRVAMTGFMLPIDNTEQMREFLLVQSLWSCCYGVPPDIHGVVRCVMPKARTTDYHFEPVLVTGTFRVEATFVDGYCADIYQLHLDTVTRL
jgi:hypothetical protein